MNGVISRLYEQILAEQKNAGLSPNFQTYQTTPNVYQMPSGYGQMPQAPQALAINQGYSLPQQPVSGLGDLESMAELGRAIYGQRAPVQQVSGLQPALNRGNEFNLQAALQAAAASRGPVQSTNLDLPGFKSYKEPTSETSSGGSSGYDSGDGGGDAGSEGNSADDGASADSASADGAAGSDGSGDGDGGDGGGGDGGGDGGGGGGDGGGDGGGERAGGLIDKQKKAALAYKQGRITFKELCRILKE